MKISKGYLQALGAYFAWGIFPIYWKLLSHLSSYEIFFHRVIWGFAFFAIILFLSRNIKITETLRLLKNHFLVILAMALLIGSNWYIYVYAVNSGHILEGSLAYFMTPIVNIVIGAVIFKERLSTGMKIAASVAGLGVLLLIVLNGTIPWIALWLAFTFSTYGVLKKRTKVGGLESSFLENLILIAPAIFAAFFWRANQTAELLPFDYILLVGGGIVSAIPILLFSLSMRVVPLNHSGVMQFIGPTLQFFIGHYMYGEPVSSGRLIAFCFVWTGVALYIRELLKPKPAIA